MRAIRTAALALAVLLTPLALIGNAYAWGPERPTYTSGEPADHPVFNSITDNPLVGDERDFVRICEKDVGATYSSDITVEPGKQYEVYIYFRNDASETYNDSEHDYRGAAREVRLSSYFPQSLQKGERGQVSGILSGTNTDPEKVWDEAYVTASEEMTLHYVLGSAKIYQDWEANGSVLSDSLFSEEGTFLGLNELNGLIPGGDKYSGAVRYTIQTEAAEEPSGEGDTARIPQSLKPLLFFLLGCAVILAAVLLAAR